MIRNLLTAMAAASLVVSPAIAQASASPASVTRGSAVLAETNELDRSEVSPWVLGVGVFAVILGILALTDTWPFDDEPASP